jgi:uncharacterized protein (DUF2252 family)
MSGARVPHPSVTERAARGKAERSKVLRSSHADWEPPRERRPAEQTLLEEAADRVPELVPMRGPWEWDVKRLAASIAIAGRELGLAPAARRGAVEEAVHSYREAMRRFATMRNLELWYARLDVARILSHVGDRVTAEEPTAFERRVAGARAKDHLRAMSKLAEHVDGAVRIVSRPPRVVPVEEVFPARASEEIEEQMRDLLRAYRRSLPPERRHLLEGYRYRHMARRVGGVGSVGTRTWIVLRPDATATTRSSCRSRRPAGRSSSRTLLGTGRATTGNASSTVSG